VEDRKTYFVDVVLPLAVKLTFTYRVPYELNDHLKIGIRAVVPFGKSKLQTGIIIKVHENVPTGYQSKYIESILDESPIVTKKQLQLWHWISEYYMAPIGDVMNAALPGNFKLASETKIQLHPDSEVNSADLSDQEYQIFEALELQDELDLKEISDILQIKTIQPIIKKLIDKRVIITKEELNQKFTPKTQLFVRLEDQYTDQASLNILIDDLSNSKRKEKQLEAVLKYTELAHLKGNYFTPILRSDLDKSGASVSAINTLERNGVFIIERKKISRLHQREDVSQAKKELSVSQERALKEIKNCFEEKEVALLHGVTGSGKTEIYVELIDEQVKKGKQVLFLIPEIALTTQLIERLGKYFGDKVGVYHSRFNQNERIEIWQAVLEGNKNKFQIIVGARSAVFLPFQDLGLIIVDEEHEGSFKQYDPSPRYNGRDVAIVLRSFFNAKVLLGSATPSLESYYNAEEGKFGLIELNERFGNIQLPEVLVANIKKEKRDRSMQSEFSSFLMEHMKEALKNKEQIILFQNRRGYNPIWACEVCGWNPMCKSCDVSLTYHKQSNLLKCHYCSYYTPPVGSCPSCGSNRLKMIGFGTEKIEDELNILLPEARVQRLDLDTTRQKNSYHSILTDFDNHKVDILVGTQMVTKGLDFDNVSLVGILDADLMLKMPDFRSFERSFQLMSQVAGRAGRKKKRGKVIIQTYDPDHHIIQRVVNHDYMEMYKNELIERKNYSYPPFYKMIVLSLRHKNANNLDMIAEDLAKALRGVFGDRILGPEYPIVKRIKNQYIKEIRIKMERQISQKKAKKKIEEMIDAFYSKPMNKSTRISINVDPL
jgi:primosomal protein N' (replication factor Y)